MERGYIDKTRLYVLLTRGKVVGEKILRILGSLLQHDNARPNTPDIAPSDYLLFRPMTHGLAEQYFHSYEDAKKWINCSIASTDVSFFLREIHMLPKRWKKGMAIEGQYFQ